MNPIELPAGSMQPPANLPGTGTVWLLGYFGTDLQYRWVAVDAGPASPPEEPGNKPPGTDKPQPKSPPQPPRAPGSFGGG